MKDRFCATVIGLMMWACMGGAVSAQLGPASTHDSWGRAYPEAFDWSGIAIGGHAGTLGVGAEGIFYVTDWLNFRVNAHYAELLYKTTIDSIDYDFDLSAPGALLLFDFYPGPKGNFRIVAGLGIRDAEVSVTGTPRVAGGGDLGRVRGKASYDTFAPYVGFGFGNAVLPDKLLSFSVDFGLLFQSYSLRVNTEGPLADNVPEAVRADIESNVKDRLDWLRVYPVIQFGLTYHF